MSVVRPSTGNHEVLYVRDHIICTSVSVWRPCGSVCCMLCMKLRFTVSNYSMFVCRTPSTALSFTAGMAAGLVEGTVCVVPMTTIQVKFCHDLSLPVPRYQGLRHGVNLIVREDGWRGLYQVRSVFIVAHTLVLIHQCRDCA